MEERFKFMAECAKLLSRWFFCTERVSEEGRIRVAGGVAEKYKIEGALAF